MEVEQENSGEVLGVLAVGKYDLPHVLLTALFLGQGNGTGEARDMYVPNPSCRDFAKYEWIGQLMGAALRGKEFLVSNPVITLSAEPRPLERRAQKPGRLSEKTALFVAQVLALPGFVWKQLSGEEVSWNKDFPAVDSVLVSRT